MRLAKVTSTVMLVFTVQAVNVFPSRKKEIRAQNQWRLEQNAAIT